MKAKKSKFRAKGPAFMVSKNSLPLGDDNDLLMKLQVRIAPTIDVMFTNGVRYRRYPAVTEWREGHRV